VSLAAASFLLMFPLYFFLRKEEFDFIREDMAPFPPSGLLAMRRLGRARRVVVAHNLQPDLKGWVKFYGPAYGLGGYAMYRMLRAGRMKYDRIICAARFLADDLRRHPRIADKIRYVPNGINLADFQGECGYSPQNGSKAIRLLSVGRMVELKGFRYAVEALSHLKDEYPQARLDILGSGPERESLERLAKQLGVADMVEFRPPVAYDQMPATYRQYQFFVMPSLTEGLPMALIEAMASRLPVVATNIPAVTTILDQRSATLCAKEDAADLARKLRWAFEHPREVRRAADRAYEIAQEFNWDSTVSNEVETD
jgi:glycosyltransferase involved in cell wall biosynthesis